MLEELLKVCADLKSSLFKFDLPEKDIPNVVSSLGSILQ